MSQDRIDSGVTRDPTTGILSEAFCNNAEPQLLLLPEKNAILRASKTAERFFSRIGVALSGKSISDIYGHAIAPLHVATQEAMERGHAYTRDIVLADAKQNALDLEHLLTAFRVDGVLYVVITIIDLPKLRRRNLGGEINNLYRQGLVEWRKAESFLREVERRHQLILHAAGEGIFGVDDQGLTTFVNPAVENMLGWRAEELIGQNMHQTVHHKNMDGSPYPVEDCPIYNAFKQRTVKTVDDEVFWRKDGRPIRVEYTSTPIIDDNDISVGAVIVFRDISERKNNEQRLRNALTENAALRERLEKENEYLQEEILTQSNHSEILGQSDATNNVVKQIQLVAPTDANILITGESGTGKELVASAIHRASDRRDRPLIRVNCAAIPRDLFESEFFGHIKGAFTGAHRDRIGRFELADGGTLFLDEVGEIPLELQSKLLRVLQEREFERLGDEKTREVDVRVIAATNLDLRDEVAAHRFREDLYFRLNVFPIHCAPLRERRGDIPLLAQHFLRQSCFQLNITEPTMTRANSEALSEYDWPGNARELQNVMERAAILARNGRMQIDLPRLPRESKRTTDRKPSPASVGWERDDVMTAQQIRQIEVQNIKRALSVAGGRVSGKNGAAELLGVKPTTLYSQIRKLRLESEV
jgi:PAS domain S-box-containing protein